MSQTIRYSHIHAGRAHVFSQVRQLCIILNLINKRPAMKIQPWEDKIRHFLMENNTLKITDIYNATEQLKTEKLKADTGN